MKNVESGIGVVTATALVLALANMGPFVATAHAFDKYSVDRNIGNCADCHGSFRNSNYFPHAAARQGIVWPAGLHDSHRNASNPSGFLNGNCNACHSGTSRFPVVLNLSNGATPFNVSCTGCHSGPGRRNHHEALVGVGTCSRCHGTEPIGNEKTPLPPVYTAPLGTTSGTTKINNPCNDGTAGRVFEGSFFDVLNVGLDNDGDTLYDQSDPDCQTASATPGEAGKAPSPMLVTAYNKASGALTISFGAACSTTDNHIEHGLLSGLPSYTYAGQVCAIGSTGSATFTVPSESFFLVVADNATNEGSYGKRRTTGTLTERPEDTTSAACPKPQNLATRCDP